MTAVEANEALEWPAILRDAAIPETISPEAQAALRSSAMQTASSRLDTQRLLCADVQRELGGRQLARYGVTLTEDEIAGVPVRIFSPATLDGTSGPVLVNLHGGGFTKDSGSITENVPIAALTGMRVVAARYRLAPEHRYPAALDDAETVYRALLAGRRPARVGLYGTSAGAILGAQLLVRLRQCGLPMPAAFGFFSGSADLSRLSDTEHFFRPASELALAGRQFEAYVDAADTRDPNVSPLLGELADFPPTLCIAGTRDFLLGPTAIFHRALLAAGVEARLIVFEAMLHAHWIYQELPESDEAFAHMADFLRAKLA